VEPRNYIFYMISVIHPFLMNLIRIILRFLAFLLATFILCNNSFSASGTNNASFMDLEGSKKELLSLVNRNSRAIVSVAVYDDTGALKNRGSGFFIDGEGRIITNSSIWKDAYSAEVLSDLNSYKKVVILNRNENLDIAIIKVKAAHEVPLELDFSNKPSLGERVVVIGKLANLNDTVSEGLISAFLKTDGNRNVIEIQTVVSILPYQTSKDGPVLNAGGKVIGVAGNILPDEKTSGGTITGLIDNSMYAVNLDSIKPLLSEAGHSEHLRPAKTRIWSKWLMSSLRAKAIKVFLYLYGIGFSTLIAVLLAIIVIFYIVEQLYLKYIKSKKII
jgi:S1-C subfamily serine protease